MANYIFLMQFDNDTSVIKYMHITTSADDILKYLEKIRIDMSCELSASQTIRMKCQALFSLKKNDKMSSLTFFKKKNDKNLVFCYK